jgi:hypothetical protein
LAIGLWLAASPVAANAQLFGNAQEGSFTLRPPRDVPSVAPGPAQSLIPPSGNLAAPKGPMLQSLPPANNPGVQVHPAPTTTAALPAGQGALAVSARFGRDLPQINGGLHWRVYRTGENGVPRLVKEEKGPAPTFTLPHGAYIVSVGFGLANVTKAVQVPRPRRCVQKSRRRVEGRVRRARPGRFPSTPGRAGSSSRAISAAGRAHDRRCGALAEGTYHMFRLADAPVRPALSGWRASSPIGQYHAAISPHSAGERRRRRTRQHQWSEITPGGDGSKV